MSETSESIHLRTDDVVGLKQALRTLRLSGLVFGPANGWITFVPYEGIAVLRQGATLDAVARQLSRTLHLVVLRYRFAEDFGWGFLAIDAEGRESSFDCWWHPEPLVEDGMLDVSILAQIGPIKSILPILQKYRPTAARPENPAYRFSRTLGLPAFEWLAPDLALHRTADLLAHGGVKVGTKPRSAETRLRLPPARKLALPRSDLSAREAYDLVRPFLTGLPGSWVLAAIIGDGAVTANGRIHHSNGRWRFVHVRPEAVETISAYLHADGNFGFRVDSGAFGPIPAIVATPLANDWLDSTVIADIAAREPWPGETGEAHGLLMTLVSEANLPLLWEVDRSRTKMHGKGGHSRHALFVDARRGEIVFETFRQWLGEKKIDARQRDRRAGSGWIATT